MQRVLALPRLQARHGALVSRLILGLLWAGWHFHPLYWSGCQPAALWFVLGTLPSSILLTWVYNGTGGSLMLSVLFHTVSKLSDWIIPIVPFLSQANSGRACGCLILIYALAAAAVFIACGPRQLVRSAVTQGKAVSL
jgi:membrane protease YdiL (CAAX protease family)